MWKIADRKLKISSIPALKDGTKLILKIERKLNCLATTFQAKTNVMMDEKANEHSAMRETRHTFQCGLPTVDVPERALKSLNEDNAFGPDETTAMKNNILASCRPRNSQLDYI